MSLAREGGSFRDPDGAVYRDGERLLRVVRPSYAGTWEKLRTSGLLEAAWRDGLLVEHEELDPASSSVDGPVYRLLRPVRVPFVSHPYEWCFGQLRDAALLTLRLQRLAMEHGLSLKDASAFNVQFFGSRPVFIDTLSFEPLEDGRPWLPYRQFCEHFLAPLALVAHRGPELAGLSQLYLDGVPLGLASRLLPRRTWLRPGLLLHLHAHARAQRTHAGSLASAERAKSARLSAAALRNLIEGLEGTLSAMRWEPEGTPWARYEEECPYAAEAAAAKEQAVGEFLTAVKPRSVFDLGANTGRFARLASRAGIFTVAIDGDAAAVELAYREARSTDDAHLLPLRMDLANPSPRLGWRQSERAGLAERGPADAALALALVHHLALGAGIPLAEVAESLVPLGRSVLLELVPRNDPQSLRLLAARAEPAFEYGPEAFERAVASAWRVERRVALPRSERVLYWLLARDS
jgi:hypothetical protein